MILSLAAMAAASCSAGEEVANIINHSKRSKRSKRILAARAFLKSITLDGGTLQEESQTARPKSLGDIPPVKNGPKKTLRIDHDTIEDDRKLISAIPSTSKAQLHHSTSIASTNVFEEGAHAREIENVRVPKSRSYVDTTSVSSSSKDRQISRLLSPRVHTYEAHQYHARSTKHMLGKRSVECDLGTRTAVIQVMHSMLLVFTGYLCQDRSPIFCKYEQRISEPIMLKVSYTDFEFSHNKSFSSNQYCSNQTI